MLRRDLSGVLAGAAPAAKSMKAPRAGMETLGTRPPDARYAVSVSSRFSAPEAREFLASLRSEAAASLRRVRAR